MCTAFEMKDRALKQAILMSETDNSFTATGTFGKQASGDGTKQKPETQHPSNQGGYLTADISADNLVKIESSPEASSQRRKLDAAQSSARSKKTKSKASDGVAGEGATPPSIRVSQIDLSRRHSSAQRNQRGAASNGGESLSACHYGPKAQ